jgi:serine/threonine protein kinase
MTTLCIHPDCSEYPKVNNSKDKFCAKCGKKLLLVERYRAISKIGEGGFGKTFKGIDELKPSKPHCVIKQFAPQAQGTSNLEKAAQLFAEEAARLDQLGKHPQIPELLAYFSQDNQQYLVQEFIDGQNLLQELTAKSSFNESQIRSLLVDILTVLKFVHSNNVIHRDIKPENIIKHNSDGKLILVDFGASKVVTNTNLSVTGTIIGSAQYTAPEQAGGKPTYASDLYSLGVTCLHLLTGVQPFDLYSYSEADWVWRDYLVNNAISEELGRILDKMVESAVKKRYQSAEEILAELLPSSNSNQIQAKITTEETRQHITNEIQDEKIKLQTPQRDFSNLDQLLAQGKWKEADQETANLMFKIMNREGKKERWLREDDCKNFPIEELKIIDQLWVKYSNGNFGFSVQKQIWLECGGKVGIWDQDIFDKWGDRLGWRKGRNWLNYRDLIFSINAPQGHFPTKACRGGGQGWRRGMVGKFERGGRVFLFSRL